MLLLLSFPVATPRSAATGALGGAQGSTLLDRPYCLSIVLAAFVIWALASTVIERR